MAGELFEQRRPASEILGIYMLRIFIIMFCLETIHSFGGSCQGFCFQSRSFVPNCNYQSKHRQFSRPKHLRCKPSISKYFCTINTIFRDEEAESQYLQLSIGKEWIPLIMNTTAQSSQGLKSVSWIANGLRVWNIALKSGRTPDISLDVSMSTMQNDTILWPGEPLFSRFSEVAQTLSLPRFVQKHPELAPSVLRGLLLLSCELESKMASIGASRSSGDVSAEDESAEIKTGDEVAGELVEEFVGTWAPALQGLGVLDSLFGTGHGLLVPGTGQSPEGADQAGFGLEDGIWRHTGWAEAPALQEQIRRMPALKQMVLIRRPPRALMSA